MFKSFKLGKNKGKKKKRISWSIIYQKKKKKLKYQPTLRHPKGDEQDMESRTRVKPSCKED